jgi:hypothetical protein
VDIDLHSLRASFESHGCQVAVSYHVKEVEVDVFIDECKEAIARGYDYFGRSGAGIKMFELRTALGLVPIVQVAHRASGMGRMVGSVWGTIKPGAGGHASPLRAPRSWTTDGPAQGCIL